MAVGTYQGVAGLAPRPYNCRQDGACMYKWAVRTTGEPQEAGLTPAAAFCTASW